MPGIHPHSPLTAVALLTSLLLACPGYDGTAGVVQTQRNGLVTSNALNPNALNLNALNLNALNLNALNLNALNLNALNLNALNLNALNLNGQGGALTREVLRYMAGCALRPDQRLELRWVDAAGTPQFEALPGVLGLAPDWAEGPLGPAGQEWVSACLASRTNFYGHPVIISSRGPHPALRPDRASSEEWATYRILEGAFWGNLFGDDPSMRSCYFEPDVEAARERLRACAAGHLGADGAVEACSFIERVGPCMETRRTSGPPACLNFNSGDFFKGCERADGSRTHRVITTWLQ